MMVMQKHVDDLEAQLQAMRCRLMRGDLDAEAVEVLHRRAGDMLEAARGGAFEPCLQSVHDLLQSLLDGLRGQQRLRELRQAA